jgi:dihydroorotate dehydrogenase electron transfer subunit
VASQRILPDQWRLAFEAPAIAASAAPGQVLHLRAPEVTGLASRQSMPIDGFDRVAGIVTIHLRADGIVRPELARLRPGERVELSGPIGRGFDVDPRSHHLLLVADGMGIAGVRALAETAVAEGRRVAVLFGARSATMVYPSSLLPDEVEYVVATDDGSLGHHGPVTDLVAEYEAWADQAFASGPVPLLAALARLAAGRDARLGVARLGRKGGGRSDPMGSVAARRKSWLQVAVEPGAACALATCLGCVVMGVQGPQRACREGPAFAADELAWEEVG